MARLILIVIATFFSCQLKAQLIINEFMASNTGAFVDPDYDESADWVELYNSGSAPIQLKGYYLTDNISDPSKWEITSAVEIAPGEYLIIWADGMDAGLHTNFKLSADGEELAIFSPSLVIVDSVTFESQSVNVSCGRKSPLSDEWAFFTEPTPGQANNSISFDGVVKSSPDFSIKGGIYNNPISLKLSTLFGGLVRYTLDGSEPNESSPLAGDEININQNTVVRARIFKDGQLPGSIVSHSYFITNGNTFHNLPIISIVSAPDNFWGEENGIYVQDFKPDWEVPVNIELFENDGSDRAAFNVQAGIKINGLYSWQLPQKMLGVYFRKEYGSGKLEYPIIFDKARKQYDTFALRASGSDWGNTLFRDGMIQNSTLDYTSIDNSGFRACVVYINGQYMGVHNIREKIDEDYVVSNHGVKAGSFDMVEETDKGHYAEAGDLVANQQFLNLVSKDLTVQAN